MLGPPHPSARSPAQHSTRRALVPLSALVPVSAVHARCDRRRAKIRALLNRLFSLLALPMLIGDAFRLQAPSAGFGPGRGPGQAPGRALAGAQS